jgi:hypothetical protein
MGSAVGKDAGIDPVLHPAVLSVALRALEYIFVFTEARGAGLDVISQSLLLALYL